MMALTKAEIAAIERRRVQQLRPEIVAYLRAVSGSRLSHVGDRKLNQEVTAWIDSGHAHGLRTAPGYKKWCFLQLYTGGRMSKAPGLSEHLTRSRRIHGTPDEGLDEIMNVTSQMLKRGA